MKILKLPSLDETISSMSMSLEGHSLGYMFGLNPILLAASYGINSLVSTVAQPAFTQLDEIFKKKLGERNAGYITPMLKHTFTMAITAGCLYASGYFVIPLTALSATKIAGALVIGIIARKFFDTKEAKPFVGPVTSGFVGYITGCFLGINPVFLGSAYGLIGVISSVTKPYFESCKVKFKATLTDAMKPAYEAFNMKPNHSTIDMFTTQTLQGFDQYASSTFSAATLHLAGVTRMPFAAASVVFVAGIMFGFRQYT
jgi:hypothetical protein